MDINILYQLGFKYIKKNRILNCQDNFQDQNGFHQDQNTTILNSKVCTTEPIDNMYLNIKQRKKKKEKKEQSSFYLCN